MHIYGKEDIISKTFRLIAAVTANKHAKSNNKTIKTLLDYLYQSFALTATSRTQTNYQPTQYKEICMYTNVFQQYIIDLYTSAYTVNRKHWIRNLKTEVHEETNLMLWCAVTSCRKGINR